MTSLIHPHLCHCPDCTKILLLRLATALRANDFARPPRLDEVWSGPWDQPSFHTPEAVLKYGAGCLWPPHSASSRSLGGPWMGPIGPSRPPPSLSLLHAAHDHVVEWLRMEAFASPHPWDWRKALNFGKGNPVLQSGSGRRRCLIDSNGQIVPREWTLRRIEDTSAYYARMVLVTQWSRSAFVDNVVLDPRPYAWWRFRLARDLPSLDAALWAEGGRFPEIAQIPQTRSFDIAPSGHLRQLGWIPAREVPTCIRSPWRRAWEKHHSPAAASAHPAFMPTGAGWGTEDDWSPPPIGHRSDTLRDWLPPPDPPTTFPLGHGIRTSRRTPCASFCAWCSPARVRVIILLRELSLICPGCPWCEQIRARALFVCCRCRGLRSCPCESVEICRSSCRRGPGHCPGLDRLPEDHPGRDPPHTTTRRHRSRPRWVRGMAPRPLV